MQIAMMSLLMLVQSYQLERRYLLQSNGISLCTSRARVYRGNVHI